MKSQVDFGQTKVEQDGAGWYVETERQPANTRCRQGTEWAGRGASGGATTFRANDREIDANGPVQGLPNPRLSRLPITKHRPWAGRIL
jgi:hypothetical protein